jgi:fructose-bisphosphate aldolase class I
LENTEDNRRTYRELLFTTNGWGEYCSGVILYEETLYQETAEGKPFVEVIQEAGVIPGIKVDMGTRVQPFIPGQKYTQGITDLDKRTARYYEKGCRFAKWRCVLQIVDDDIPQAQINDVAQTLAKYAAICQMNGLVPIVEPEILMDGTHSLAVNQRCTEKTLSACYKALNDHNVMLEGTLLKPNMCLKGKQCEDATTFEQNGLATVTALRRTVPASVPGITFLSGGQTEEEATMNLNAMNKYEGRPWSLTFSFGRALQASVLKTWQGKKENVEAAQKMLLRRAKANGMANQGTYDGFAADPSAKETLYQKNYTY